MAHGPLVVFSQAHVSLLLNLYMYCIFILVYSVCHNNTVITTEPNVKLLLSKYVRVMTDISYFCTYTLQPLSFLQIQFLIWFGLISVLHPFNTF